MLKLARKISHLHAHPEVTRFQMRPHLLLIEQKLLIQVVVANAVV